METPAASSGQLATGARRGQANGVKAADLFTMWRGGEAQTATASRPRDHPPRQASRSAQPRARQGAGPPSWN